MDNASLPRAGDWNNFWQKSHKSKSHISWSKKRIINTIQPYVVRGKSALDAGCGSGFFSKYFCDEGMKVTALDYSQQALALAKELTHGKTDILQADLLNPNITSEVTSRFDLIFTDGLLEHFKPDDQDLIMLNFRKLLNENGVILTFVPNKFSPWELIRPYFMPGIEEDPFTLKQLIDLNERNKLTILKKGGINTLPLPGSPDTALGSNFGMLLYTLSKSNGPA